MAEHKQEIDFVAVTAEDIMPERMALWNAFTKASTYGIAATVVLLLFIKLITH